MVVELALHDNGPDVDADIKDDNSVETHLGAAALAEALHVEDETEAEASDAEGSARASQC